MKKIRSHRFLTGLLVAVGTVFGLVGVAQASTLSEVQAASERVNTQARQSQARIDALNEQTRRLLNDYRTVTKETEGLRVFNRQLERQIANQEREKVEIANATEQVTVIERQITPLMLRMIDGLDQFVELDVPFLLTERRNRVQGLRDMMDRADVSPSEKFSQIFQAYQIENEYGRTMEAYSDVVRLDDGRELTVDVLRVGRIALLYQTSDGQHTGAWNAAEKRWERLPDRYRTSVNNGIRMANQQMSVNLLNIPVPGPEQR